jgi:hypothetical protein
MEELKILVAVKQTQRNHKRGREETQGNSANAIKETAGIFLFAIDDEGC